MTENDLELACINWFKELGWNYVPGEELAPDAPNQERDRYSDTILYKRLLAALRNNNPKLPDQSIDEALRKIKNASGQSLVDTNKDFYIWMRNGIPVEVEENGDTRILRASIFNWENIDANDWLITNQFTIKGVRTVRPDMIAFVNGLPLIIIELKNPADEQADIWKAFNQIKNYQNEVPKLFEPSLANIISDGYTARFGSITSSSDWYTPWRMAEGIEDYAQHLELEVMIKGLCERNSLLNYFRHFVAYKTGNNIIKIIAGYHQFFGVRYAVKRAIGAVTDKKDGKGGVVWFTQGSGKSMLALFYAAMLREQPELKNPTIVVVTDRNDLDGQLFEDFATCNIPLGVQPKQANSRDDLRQLLGSQKAGGVFFTTIQKFAPEDPVKGNDSLCDRENVIVICDEAHRTQYGFKANLNRNTGEIRYGLATYMRQAIPNATYIGLTGTPIDDGDRDTEDVFGSYIDIIYDVKASQADGNTVPLQYESRIINLSLNQEELESLNEELEALDPDADEETQNKIATRLARLESIAMADGRLKTLAEDLIAHWEKRKEVLEGKAMIVAMSRKAAVALYDEIIAIRPQWHSDSLTSGKIKVVMTSAASDPENLRKHSTNKNEKELIKNRLKDPDDELEIVIVRDMWLTGTNIPILNTMYVDKPMKGHGLMQAIARINRVWKDKPGGLIVDYIGIGEQLKAAIANYTRHTGGKGASPIDNIEKAVKILLDTVSAIREFLGGFNYDGYQNPQTALTLLPSAVNYVLSHDPKIEKGKNRGVKRFMDLVSKATKAQALAGTDAKALLVRDEIAFYQAVKAGLVKYTYSGQKLSRTEKEAAMRQLVAKGVLVDGVTDLYATMGIENPDLSLLSDSFLAQLQTVPQKNLAAELLQRLLSDEIKSRARKNKAQGKKFSKRLEEAINRYQNRGITTAQVIAELTDMARDLMSETPPNDTTEDEFAFYQALAESESAVKELGDPILRALASELTDKLRKSATIDWQHKSSARAKMRTQVKILLKRYRYPPDKEPEAIKMIVEQAELFADEWAIEY